MSQEWPTMDSQFALLAKNCGDVAEIAATMGVAKKPLNLADKCQQLLAAMPNTEPGNVGIAQSDETAALLKSGHRPLRFEDGRWTEIVTTGSQVLMEVNETTSTPVERPAEPRRSALP